MSQCSIQQGCCLIGAWFVTKQIGIARAPHLVERIVTERPFSSHAELVSCEVIFPRQSIADFYKLRVGPTVIKQSLPDRHVPKATHGDLN